MCAIDPRFGGLQPRIDVSSPYGGFGLAVTYIDGMGLSAVQQAVALFRPVYGQMQSYQLSLSGDVIATSSALPYLGVKVTQSVRMVVATSSLYFTDHLDSPAAEVAYRTVRVAFILFDEDFRPNVARTSVVLRLSGGGGGSVESYCGLTQSAASHHTCSLTLGLQDFTTTDTSASLELTAGTVSVTSAVNLVAIPLWVSTGTGYGNC